MIAYSYFHFEKIKTEHIKILQSGVHLTYTYLQSIYVGPTNTPKTCLSSVAWSLLEVLVIHAVHYTMPRSMT